jgi:hypothetical protein
MVMKGMAAQWTLAGLDARTGQHTEYYSEADTKLYYLELPLLLNANIPSWEEPTIKFCAGPFVAANVGASQRIHNGLTLVDVNLGSDTTYSTDPSRARRVDCGFTLGFLIPFGRLGFGGRVTWGFIEAIRPAGDDVTKYFDHRNRTFTIAVEYSL